MVRRSLTSRCSSARAEFSNSECTDELWNLPDEAIVVTMDKSQLGRAGELALSLYGLVTSGGELELYSPVVDDDHIDLVAGRRRGLPALGIQVKTTDGLDANGLVEAAASYPEGEVREDEAFVYTVLLLDSVRISAAWLVPSAEFNRRTYRHVTEGRDVLEFRASPERQDAFAGFRVEPMLLGAALLARVDSAPAAPDWLRSLVRAVPP
jgi:hypothetical protein